MAASGRRGCAEAGKEARPFPSWLAPVRVAGPDAGKRRHRVRSWMAVRTRIGHPIDLARPNGRSRLDVPDRQVLGLRAWFVLTEPRVRILRRAVLEGQDVWVLDDAPADLDGPPDGLIEVP